MSGRLRNVAITLKWFAKRTTVHGLLHIFQSHNRMRQVFWLILLLGGLSVGLFHTVKTMEKFMENPVRSQLKLMSEEAVFPDITICNLKPASETLSMTWDLFDYFYTDWQRFDNWQKVERIRLPNEDIIPFHERLRKIFRQQFQVMWVSGDTRDIGHFDKTMVLYCRYNGITCDHRNFTLIQTSKFWNCYTFDVNSQNSIIRGIGGSGAELELIVYTDNYNKYHVKGDKQSKIDNIVNISIKQPMLDMKNMPLNINAYMYFINCMNQILRQGRFKSGGLRLFFHDKLNHPLLSKEFLDMQAGKSSEITLRPIKHRLVSGKSHNCSMAPHDKIKYVRYFSHGSQDIVTREYNKTVKDFAVEAKQKMVYENCGCYSHRYPFQVNNSQLCYYVSPEHWKSPPDNVLRNIKCHDKWILNAVNKSIELMEKFKEQSSCEFTRFRPWQQSTSWPRSEHIVDIWDDLIVPQIENGIEFLPSDQRKHHIFNITADYMYPDALSREVILFIRFILEDSRCSEYFCGSLNLTCNKSLLQSEFRNAGKCVERHDLSLNMAKIRVKLHSSMADVYEEELSYDWTEALSEIGGIFGLYVGVSLLIVFEVMEFVYLIIAGCLRN